MDISYTIYSALMAFGIAVLAVAMLLSRFWGCRQRRWKSTLRDKYLRAVIDLLMSEKGADPQFPMIDQPGARLMLAEVINGLVAATYGLDQMPLRRIVCEYRLGEYLLRRIRFTQGYRRARNLALLSYLPCESEIRSRVSHYTDSRNRYVRFGAFLVRLAGDPAIALRLMAEYPHPFSAYEVSEIMTMLRRGMLPIAYEPLVRSSVPNLQTVGIGIIRQFGIEEAEKHLRRLVGSGIPGLGHKALYTLCALQRPLDGVAIGRCVAAMSSTERKALIRFMALEGYTPQTLQRIFDTQEQNYYNSLVQSYKRCLA